MDKDIDLVKVQMCADFSHANFSALLSFVFGYFIALIILSTTILFQNYPFSQLVWLVGMIGAFISTIGFLALITWDYMRDIKTISKMIEAIKEGKQLPRLSELIHRRRLRRQIILA